MTPSEILNYVDLESFDDITPDVWSQFTYDELYALAVDILNSYIMKDHTSSDVMLSNGFQITCNRVLTLMENLPIIDVFFDSQALTAYNYYVPPLEIFLGQFFDFMLSKQRSESRDIFLIKLCLLSWHECLASKPQHMLSAFISDMLANHLASHPQDWPFSTTHNAFENSDILRAELVFVTFVRLFYMAANTNADFTQNGDSNNLASVYNAAFTKLSESRNDGPNLRLTDREAFIGNAMRYFDQFASVHGRISSEVPNLAVVFSEPQTDANLVRRLNLGHNLYLTQTLSLLNDCPNFLEHVSSVCLKEPNVPRIRKLLTNLLAKSKHQINPMSQANLIAWNIDRGILVKEFALAFLTESSLGSAPCSAKVIPRLIGHMPLLTADSSVAWALLMKLRHLRTVNLPSNHHEELLKAIVSNLSNEVKSQILSALNTCTEERPAPLPPDDSKFRFYLRKFFNRLSVGSKTSTPTKGKVWRDNQAAKTVNSEVLLEADLLLWTRPLDFLIELLHFPVVQNSLALLPVIYKILHHFDYSFDVVSSPNGTASILRQLLINLLKLIDSEVLDSESSNESTVSDVWHGEARQRMALMYYLPRSGDLDPKQVNLAVRAAEFSASAASAFGVGDVGADEEATKSKAAIRKLWIHALVCLMDQPKAWSQLSSLTSDSTEVLINSSRVEIMAQSLSLLLLPKPGPDLTAVAPHVTTTCLHLLQRLPSPLTVRICTAVRTIIDREARQDLVQRTLEVVLHDPSRLLLAQSLDYLPWDAVGHCVVTVPTCLLRSRLVTIETLQANADKHFKFVAEDDTSSTGQCFAQPLSSCDLAEVFQLAGLCDTLWLTTVSSLLDCAQNPSARRVWSSVSGPTLILALYTVLQRISANEAKAADAIDYWARVMGCVDQLVCQGVLSIQFSPRSPSKESKSPKIFLGDYQGTLDLFDLIYGLLQLLNYSSANGMSVTPMSLGRVCQTLTVLAQRLVTRLTSQGASSAEVEFLIQQTLLVIREIGDHEGKRSSDVGANSPLSRLLASLEMVANSVSSQMSKAESDQILEEREGDLGKENHDDDE